MLNMILGNTEVEPSRLYIVNTKSAIPIYTMALQVIDATGGDVVIVDGGNRANPYPLVSLCKERGIDHELVLDHVHVSRAFTAYQLESIIIESIPRILRIADVKAILVMRPGAMFRDDQLDEFEARCMFARCMRTLERLARENDLYLLVSDRPLGPHLLRRGTEISLTVSGEGSHLSSPIETWDDDDQCDAIQGCDVIG